MAKIIKVGSQNITPNKIANPFRTSRNSTTNPFKYSNFEGNTLQFADVFDGYESKKSGKMKLIASSVTGSMNKISRISESIVNFVNRVRTTITGAWDYAKNTNISDVAGFRAISNAWDYAKSTNISDITGIHSLTDSFNKLGENISGSMASIGKGISSKLEFLNTDVTDIGKAVSDKWLNIVTKIGSNKINSNTSVAELEMLWKNEIANAGEVA